MRCIMTIDKNEASVSASDYERIEEGRVYRFNGVKKMVVWKKVLYVGGPTVKLADIDAEAKRR